MSDVRKTICVYEDDTNPILKTIDEEFVEIDVDLYLQLEDVDYGVPGSPVWKEVFDYDIELIRINESVYTFKEFKAKYNEVVVKEVLMLISEAIDEIDLY